MDIEATLISAVRPPDGQPDGALILIHGRGADERDLFPLFDMLDPGKRLVGLAPRGPLSLPPGGAHWYVVQRVGFPDPGTFFPTFERLSQWLDESLDKAGVPFDRTIIGGFSQGAVMSYALTLGKGRPRPAGLLGMSGFIPTVEGFELDLEAAAGLPVAIAHGTYDPVISVEFSQDAARRLTEAGADVIYRESPMPHTIDPAFLEEVHPWIEKVLPRFT